MNYASAIAIGFCWALGAIIANVIAHAVHLPGICGG